MHIIRLDKTYKKIPQHELEDQLNDLRDELAKLAKHGISTSKVCEARLLLGETISAIKDDLIAVGVYEAYVPPDGFPGRDR